jgi:hypothetical protein
MAFQECAQSGFSVGTYGRQTLVFAVGDEAMVAQWPACCMTRPVEFISLADVAPRLHSRAFQMSIQQSNALPRAGPQGRVPLARANREQCLPEFRLATRSIQAPFQLAHAHCFSFSPRSTRAEARAGSLTHRLFGGDAPKGQRGSALSLASQVQAWACGVCPQHGKRRS